MSGWIAWHVGALLLMLQPTAPMSPALLPQGPSAAPIVLQSLSALGNVIAALTDPKGRDGRPHVPYRCCLRCCSLRRQFAADTQLYHSLRDPAHVCCTARLTLLCCHPSRPAQRLQADAHPGGQPGWQLQNHLHGHGVTRSGGLRRCAAMPLVAVCDVSMRHDCGASSQACLEATSPLCRPAAESLSTLKFANRAKCMRNLPKVGDTSACGFASLQSVEAACMRCCVCLPRLCSSTPCPSLHRRR